MPRARRGLSLKRVGIYILAALLPPVMIGTMLAFSSISRVMIREAPVPPSGFDAKRFAPPKSAPRKMNALILVSNAGTQTTDLLGSFELLSASGLFNVYTAAPERKISGTTSDLGVLPDYALADAPEPGLLVVPSLLDFSEPKLLAAVREKLKNAKALLVLGEGSRLVANAGDALAGKNVAANFSLLKTLEKEHPETHWDDRARFIVERAPTLLVSSAGGLSSLDATLAMIEELGGKKAADKTARLLSYQSGPALLAGASPHVAPLDLFELFVRSAFDWSKETVSAWVYPGVDEIGLAAVLDVFPRTMSLKGSTIAETRDVFQTSHGLKVIPGSAYSQGDSGILVIPGGSPGPGRPPFSIAVQRWVLDNKVLVKSFVQEPVGRAFPLAFDLLPRLDSMDRLAVQFAAKMVYYPKTRAELAQELPPELPFLRAALLLPALALAFLGIVLAWLIEGSIRKKMRALGVTKR